MIKKTKLQEIRQALSSKYLERAEVVDGLLVAVLSKEPILLVGNPGTAKSALCRDVSRAISGSFFSWMLTKFTVPEELFGPLSLKGLEQDKYARNTTGKLPEADIVFVDEVGKASSSISNTMLTIMNEREFFNDGKAQPVPMVTLFGASNEIPQAEELGAFYDRFVLRFFVNPVRDDASVAKLFEGGFGAVKVPTITLKEIRAEIDKAALLVLSPDIVKLLVQVRRAIEQEGIIVSDRKWVQSVGVIKAFAHLNGHTAVEPDDLDILVSMLWSTPEQISQVRKVVTKIINPINEKVLQIMDSLAALPKSFSDEEAVEVYKKVTHAKRELGKLGDASKSARLARALEDVEVLRKIVADKALAE